MGIRSTQIFGLTEEAERFLKDNVAREDTSKCPTCGHVKDGEMKSHMYKDASSTGMFGDGPHLTEYTMRDGSTIREIIQDIHYSSGPCIFLCLEKDGARMFEWAKEDLIEYL